jgi:F0F1-type ATP synthase membrane subunit b/b'
MKKKIQGFTAILIAVLFCGVSLAQEPVVNIDKKIHPNLAEAQRLVAEANHYVAEAQKDNRYDMKGHAEKARQLLVQANLELKAAAEAANASIREKGKR